MKNKMICLIAVMLFSFTTNAADNRKTKLQKKERTLLLWGHIADSFTKVGIPGTFITLMRADSSVIDTMHVNYFDGETSKVDTYYNFTVPAVPQKFIILAQHAGYKDCYINFDMKHIARNDYFDAPWHFMHKKIKDDYDVTLGEVVIKATKIKIVHKGDTLIFNADAFNLPQGSMLDDLIKQMPGVKLKDNGEITVNGRKVDYLTLNGKEFFKGNNKVMLENLPYYIVKNVQVYNKSTKKSEYLGREAEKKDFVMDVSLKREFSKGYIANAEGGKGTEDRYMARLFGLRYTDNSRISLFGNVNNVNESRSPGSDGEWGESHNQQGTQSVKNIGFDLAIDDKNKLYNENASAQFSWTDNDNMSRSTSETYLSTGNSFSRSRSFSNNNNFNFSANNSFSINKPFHLDLNTSISYTNSDNKSLSHSATFDKDPSHLGDTNSILDSLFNNTKRSKLDSITVVNKNNNQSTDNSKSLNLSQSISFMKKLAWGDDFSLDYNINYSNTKSKTFTLYQLDYPQTATTDYQNQYADNRDRAYDYKATARYTFHLLSKWNVGIMYSYGQNWKSSHNPKYRLDRLNGWGAGTSHLFGTLPSTADSLLLSLDASNSSYTNYMKKENATSLNITYNNNIDSSEVWLSINLPLTYRKENEHYQRSSIDTSFCQRNWIFIPNMYLSVRKGAKNFMLSYLMDVMTPNAQDLVNMRDDSNPLSVRLGNPNLKNSILHNVDITYYVYKDRSLFGLGLHGNIQRNSITEGYTYNSQTGLYTYKPENINGNWSFGIGTSYSSYFDKNKLWSWEIRQAGLNYNHLVYLASESNATQSSRCSVNSYTIEESGSTGYQKGDLSVYFLESFNWQHSGSGMSSVKTTNVFDCNYGFIFKYMFPLKLQFSTDITMQSRRGMSDSSLNTDNLVWNASLSHAFIKGNLILKVDGYDILHKLSQTQYSITSNGTMAIWNNSIPRYFMAHLIYKINVMPKKK